MNISYFKIRKSYKWWVLLTVSISNVMVTTDISILMVVLPRLEEFFHTNTSVIGWLNIIYFIMSQSLMLTFSKIADVKGRKMIFIVAIAVYSIGLVTASLSRSVLELILSRAVQGAAGATITALSIAITVAIFPEKERGKSLGVLLGAASIGLVAGPSLGGIILDFLGWRAVFYIRIPVMLIALIMSLIILEEQKRPPDRPYSFDYIGSISLFFSISGLLLLLSFGVKQDMIATLKILVILVTVFAFIAFLIAERKAPEPIVDLGLFRNRIFSIATLSCIVTSTASTSIPFLLPFYLMGSFSLSGTGVGLYVALIACPALILAPLAGRLSDRIGSGLISSMAVAIICIGLVFLMISSTSNSFLYILAGIILDGSGVGIFHPPNNSAIVGSAPREMLGVASAIGSVARNIGASIAMALGGALYNYYKSYHLFRFQKEGFDLAVANRMAVEAGFSDTMMIMLSIGCIAFFISLLRAPISPKRLVDKFR
ncbi:MAG: MFS transporter [Deltaproteobacteria bacterium]|nr:MFS transporter [Deltaproteobacteria bacterium]